jgi:hypothetical protein
MKIILVACAAAALATAACTHATQQPAVARVDGAQHVVVRAEAGRIWWQHREWTEPHELWTLPSGDRVENLSVARDGDAFIVSFEQGGTSWSGRFGETTNEERPVTKLAKGEPR